MSRISPYMRRRKGSGESRFRRALGRRRAAAVKLSAVVVALGSFAAIGALSPAGAAAAVCQHKAGSSKWEVCIKGEALGNSFEVKKVNFVAKGSGVFSGFGPPFGNGSAPLGCEIESQGTLESGRGSVTITGIRYTLAHCEYTVKPIKEECTVGEPTTTELRDQLTDKTGESQIEPISGITITTIQPRNAPGHTCPAAMQGSYPLTGYFGEKLVEPEAEKAAHTLTGVAKETLRAGGSSAKLTSELKMELTGEMKGRTFSIIEGS